MIVLDQIRKRLGPTPRSFTPEDQSAIRLRFLPFLQTTPWDSLTRLSSAQTTLRERGDVVWAYTIQANDFLFNPGLNWEAHAATVIHGSPEIDDPSVLSEVTQRLYEVRENADDKTLRKTVESLFHPSRRKYHEPVPEAIANGREIWCSDVLVFRKLLPPEPNGARLRKPAFPLFVARGETRIVMQVPSRFWPDEFLNGWAS